MTSLPPPRISVTLWRSLILAVVLSPLGLVEALSCSSCDSRVDCPRELACDGGTTVDVCGCCVECARVVNETCGGPFFMYGKCDEGLVCVIAPVQGQKLVNGEEVGTCKVVTPDSSPPSCDDIYCPSLNDFSPEGDKDSSSPFFRDILLQSHPSDTISCPADSVTVITRRRPPDPRCCDAGDPALIEAWLKLSPVSTDCRCQTCSWSMSSGAGGGGDEMTSSSPCEAGFIRVLKSEGRGLPGQCCDEFECIEHATFCQHVECEEEAEPTCPEDSFLLPTLVTPDGCCFVQSGCECKPKDSCPEVECSPEGGSQKRVRVAATGQPGSCCDQFDCVNGSNPICLSNGTVHNDGDKWNKDACTVCECRGSLAFCQPQECPTLARCSWMGTPEGSCCPVCKGCVSQTGELYATGAVWKQDSCVTCRCEGGQVYCQAEMCSLGCVNLRVVPDECCPVCDDPPSPNFPVHCPALSNCSLMCMNGYARSSDGCYQCHCVDRPEMCEDLDCPDGYLLDDDGEELCECVKDEDDDDDLPPLLPITSTSTTLPFHDNTTTSDPGTLLSPSNSTPEFPDHLSNITKNDLEEDSDLSMTGSAPPIIADNASLPLPTSTPESFRSSSTAEHTVTTTTGLSLIVFPACPPMLGCSRHCSYGYKTDRQGCPRCRCHKCPPFDCSKKCSMGFALSAERCRLCKCRDHSFVDPGSQTSPPWLPPLGGRHCSALDGQRMDEGQTWWDGCRKCFCHEGHEMCALVTCPALRCPNPVMRIGSCCLSCPGEVGPVGPLGTAACHSADGRYFVEGETWLLDECTQCICHQGAALCAIDSCPPLLCHHPIVLPHSCCPICPGSSGSISTQTNPWKDQRRMCRSPGGTQYSSGDTWQVNDCQSCVCRDGQIHCFAQTCPVLACNRVVQKKGQCCSICLDAREKACYHNSEIYSVNESWIVNDCTKCSCIDGQVLCTVTVCSGAHGASSDATDCTAVVQQPGVCCPVCLDGSNRNKTLGMLAESRSSLFSHPAVLTLAIVVIILAIVIIILLLRRRACLVYRSSHRGSPSFHGGAVPSLESPKKCYVTASVGAVTAASSDFDSCCHVNESNSSGDYASIGIKNPYSASTASTKLSSSSSRDSILKLPHSPSPSSNDCEITKDCSEDEDGKYSRGELCDANYVSSEFPTDFPDDGAYHDGFRRDPEDYRGVKYHEVEAMISSSMSTLDVKDKISLNESGMQDSDDATDDARFESSKRLIDKKRNRRSAGDELEQSAARHLLMATPTDRHEGVASGVNRRSW